MAFSGVFPVYNLKFKIGTKGKASTEQDMVAISEMESFSISIDGTVEEWTSMTNSGWASSLMTGKKYTIGLNGKRCVGDPGNDYVANTAWKDGLDCSTKGEVEFPDGAKLTYDCVINVKNVGGGDSTNVAPLEFEMQGDGKPTYTPATIIP
ncbi:phage tail tube protein [Clostridium sp. UBA871]|uniref:phage tail tube protein n=1 Tax=Clostridium sp. UBA871 TaxID=1946380 RepID=UPI00321737ED